MPPCAWISAAPAPSRKATKPSAKKSARAATTRVSSCARTPTSPARSRTRCAKAWALRCCLAHCRPLPPLRTSELRRFKQDWPLALDWQALAAIKFKANRFMGFTTLSLKGRALRLLSQREHSRSELAAKLAPHAESPEELAALLDQLVEQDWLSDQRAAQSLVHRRGPRLG